MRYFALGVGAALLLWTSPIIAADTTATTPGTATPAIGSSSSSATRSLSGSSSLNENEARQKLEQQGFTDITNLKEENGTWMGQASKGGHQVTVDIQPDGTVTSK